MKQGSLSKFPNRNWSVLFSNKLLKIDHTMIKLLLKSLHFQLSYLNVNKTDVVMYFSKPICHFP